MTHVEFHEAKRQPFQLENENADGIIVQVFPVYQYTIGDMEYKDQISASTDWLNAKKHLIVFYLIFFLFLFVFWPRIFKNFLKDRRHFISIQLGLWIFFLWAEWSNVGYFRSTSLPIPISFCINIATWPFHLKSHDSFLCPVYWRLKTFQSVSTNIHMHDDMISETNDEIQFHFWTVD